MARWFTPFAITSPRATRIDSSVAAITRFNGALDAFWIWPDGAIGSNWANPGVDNGKWHTPFPITPPRAARNNSPIAAITRFDGALDVFWIWPDGAIGSNWANPGVDNGNWHTPFPITPPNAARNNTPIAAVTRFDGALDVFWIGLDGAIWTNWANPHVDNGNWHTPFPITPPNVARDNSPIAAVTRFDGALDVFWIWPDGAIGSNWANPHVDNGNWHSPFPITPPHAAGKTSSLAAITRLNGALDAFWIGPDSAVGTNWTNPNLAVFAIVPIYWGAKWRAAKPFGIGAMNQAIAKLCASPFVEGLVEYSVGDMIFVPAAGVVPGDVPNAARNPNIGFTNDDVIRVIVGELDNGRTPVPAALPQGVTPVYIVLIEQGCFVAGNPYGEVGEHHKFRYGDRDYLWGWVYQGADVDGTTPGLGHEFVEAVTYEITGSEIGDPCERLTGKLSVPAPVGGEVNVQAYLSKRENVCIIPGVLRRVPVAGVTGRV